MGFTSKFFSGVFSYFRTVLLRSLFFCRYEYVYEIWPFKEKDTHIMKRVKMHFKGCHILHLFHFHLNLNNMPTWHYVFLNKVWNRLNLSFAFLSNGKKKKKQLRVKEDFNFFIANRFWIQMFVKNCKENSPLTLQEPANLSICLISHVKHRRKGTLSKVKRGRKYFTWEEYVRYLNYKDVNKDKIIIIILVSAFSVS